MKLWMIYIFIATIFFVLGQFILKFDSNEAILTVCYFSISMGLTGLFCLMYLYKQNKKIISYYGILAGILFFFGNFLWILSIKNAPSLSLIRVIMAGGETLLLIIGGYLIFKEQIFSFYNMFGIGLILSGVFLISLA